MKIVYSGGYNKKLEESIKNSHLYIFYPAINKAIKSGKKIVFVTLAKPDGYYDHLILPLYNNTVDIVQSTNLSQVNWANYDGIFLFGGSEIPLYNGLKKTNFDLKNLKKDALILGDSAGAYVLSSYFYSLPPGEMRGEDIKFHKGFNPKAKVITIAHKNNPVYTNKILIKKVNEFAKDQKLRVLMLNENEQKLLDNGQFVDFDKDTLF